jgi:hypothetical protein
LDTGLQVLGEGLVPGNESMALVSLDSCYWERCEVRHFQIDFELKISVKQSLSSLLILWGTFVTF